MATKNLGDVDSLNMFPYCGTIVFEKYLKVYNLRAISSKVLHK